jgi:hypothetical protein
MSVLTGLQIVLDLRHGGTPAYARLIIAKLVLVAVAVGAGWLLSPVTSWSDFIHRQGKEGFALLPNPQVTCYTRWG